MPPKSQDKPNKKAIREKAASSIEEQSFGLKNKNKSKKVQQFIARVEKGVKNSTGLADAAKAKEAKKEAKIAKQLEEEQLRSLLNEGISNQFGKNKKQAQSAASKLGIAEVKGEVAKILEEFSSDDDSEDDFQKRRKGPDTYIIDDEPVAVEVFREKTIEDIVEEQRAKLSAEGKKGTPVTSETFAIWRAAKLAKRQAEAEARVKAEQSKKKGGKGLSVLSGKELFNYNSSLFIDDDAALDAKEEKELAAEAKLAEELEEAKQAEEAKKAQEEQERLQEIQRIELEEKERKYEERRQRAVDPNRPMFLLGSIIINEVVFIEDESEDLSLFPEVIFSTIDPDDNAIAVSSSSNSNSNSNSSNNNSYSSAAATTDDGTQNSQSFEIDMGDGSVDDEDNDDDDDEGDEEDGDNHEGDDQDHDEGDNEGDNEGNNEGDNNDKDDNGRRPSENTG